MSDQVTPSVVPVVELWQLFAMPLTALIEADRTAAESFVRVIREIGFTNQHGTDWGDLVTVSFSYTRLNESGRPERSVIEIPLILLIPLPTLAIQDARLRFDVEILGVMESTEKAPGGLNLVEDGKERRRGIGARIARERPALVSSDPGGPIERMESQSRTSMDVVVNLRQSDLPQGILQMINLTAQGTQDNQIATPFFSFRQLDGVSTFQSVGESATIELQLNAPPGVGLEGHRISLSQAPDSVFSFRPRRIETDDAGRARFVLELRSEPSTRIVTQTISASATVDSERSGPMLVQGSTTYVVRFDDSAPIAPSGSRRSTGPGQTAVSVNSASATELATLPGISRAVAQRIVEYRNQHGSFTSEDELLNVDGVGPSRLERIRRLITIR